MAKKETKKLKISIYVYDENGNYQEVKHASKFFTEQGIIPRKDEQIYFADNKESDKMGLEYATVEMISYSLHGGVVRIYCDRG